jgi:surface antigen
MKSSSLALVLLAATVAAMLCPLTATPARADDTTIKHDARHVGHVVSRDAQHVGHTVAAHSRKLGHTIARQSRDAGHAIAHGARQVGSKVRIQAHKAKAFVEDPPPRKTGPR